MSFRLYTQGLGLILRRNMKIFRCTITPHRTPKDNAHPVVAYPTCDLVTGLLIATLQNIRGES